MIKTKQNNYFSVSQSHSIIQQPYDVPVGICFVLFFFFFLQILIWAQTFRGHQLVLFVTVGCSGNKLLEDCFMLQN